MIPSIVRTPQGQERPRFQLRLAKPILWHLGFGALLEVMVLFALIPKDSSTPPTRFQELLTFTQAPWIGLVAVLKEPDDLPQLVNVVVAVAVTITGFLVQSAIMGLPFWLVIRFWARRRQTRLSRSPSYVINSQAGPGIRGRPTT